MTLPFMEGFENVNDDSDLTTRGWTTSTAVNLAGNSVLTVPSRTGQPGRGLMLKGPYSTVTASLPMYSAAAVDFGVRTINRSVYSLWQAGGFVLGMNATFNRVQCIEVASYNASQIVYDGAKYYWAILRLNLTNYTVGYSTDLINWTAVAVPPPNQAMSVQLMLSVSGTGLTATVVVSSSWMSSQVSAAQNASYYTTNAGGSWTAITNATTDTYNATTVYTGNSTYPWIRVGVNTNGAGANPGIVTVFGNATVGAAGTSLLSLGNTGSISANANATCIVSRVKNGFLCISFQSSSSYTSPPTALVSGSVFWTVVPLSAVQTPASYLASAAISVGQQTDITFFNNLWISVGYQGIYYAQQAGTVGAPLGPTGAWSPAVTWTATTSVYAIDNNGSIAVAVGQDPVTTTTGAIWTSVDGINWTKVNHFLVSSAAAAPAWFSSVIWDGSRFVIFGTNSNNVIATSPDGLAWTPTYYPDYAEGVDGNSASPIGVFGGTIVSGAFVPYSTSSSVVVGMGLNAAAQSNNARTITPLNIGGNGGSSSAGAVAATASVALTLTHFLEIIATAVAGTANLFTFTWALDGTVIGSMVTGNQPLASSSDTAGATQLVIGLPRNGQWTVIDDVYVTDFAADAGGGVGQLGPVNIFGAPPAADVGTDGFAQTSGSAASNAAMARGPLSTARGTLSSYTAGSKDVYSTASALPSSFTVIGVQAEAFFEKLTPTAGTASVGIKSGTAEVDSPAVSTPTLGVPVYASTTTTVDPNTGKAWTNAAAAAADIVINKLS